MGPFHAPPALNSLRSRAPVRSANLMNVRHLVSRGLSADKFHINVNNEAFFVDVIIGLPHVRPAHSPAPIASSIKPLYAIVLGISPSSLVRISASSYVVLNAVLSGIVSRACFTLSETSENEVTPATSLFCLIK
jgi:hypothetical protein